MRERERRKNDKGKRNEKSKENKIKGKSWKMYLTKS